MGGTGVAEGSNQGRQVGCCTDSQNTGIKPRVCDKACSPDFQEVPQAPLSQRDADCMHCPSILEGNHSVSAEHQSTSNWLESIQLPSPFLAFLNSNFPVQAVHLPASNPIFHMDCWAPLCIF